MVYRPITVKPVTVILTPAAVSHASINIKVTGTLSRLRDSPLTVHMKLFYHWMSSRVAGDNTHLPLDPLIGQLHCRAYIFPVVKNVPIDFSAHAE